MKTWTTADLKYIRQHLEQTDSELAKHFGVKKHCVARVRKDNDLLKPNDGKFKKGQKVWNKGMKGIQIGGKETQFKKGNIPHNAYRKDFEAFVIPDGRGYPYSYIKLPTHRQYPLGKYNWEQHHGQKFPANHIIRYKDGDTSNCELSNIEPITRAQHLQRNHNRPKAAESMRKSWANRRIDLPAYWESLRDNDVVRKTKKKAA